MQVGYLERVAGHPAVHFFTIKQGCHLCQLLSDLLFEQPKHSLQRANTDAICVGAVQVNDGVCSPLFWFLRGGSGVVSAALPARAEVILNVICGGLH